MRNVKLLLLMIMSKIVSYNFLKGKAKGKETGIPEEFVQWADGGVRARGAMTMS